MFTYDVRVRQGTCRLVCEGQGAADFCRCAEGLSGDVPAQYIDVAHSYYAFAAYLLGYAHWQAGGSRVLPIRYWPHDNPFLAGTGLHAVFHIQTTS